MPHEPQPAFRRHAAAHVRGELRSSTDAVLACSVCTPTGVGWCTSSVSGWTNFVAAAGRYRSRPQHATVVLSLGWVIAADTRAGDPPALPSRPCSIRPAADVEVLLPVVVEECRRGPGKSMMSVKLHRPPPVWGSPPCGGLECCEASATT